MFGIVPKVLWQKVAEPDEQNRILLATRSLLAVNRSAGRVVLVDTGCGTKWPADEAGRYGIVSDAAAIPESLRAIGLATDDVTDVVVTHLHFDHNGGLTYWYDDPGGAVRLTYPKATHWIHRTHWLHARSPSVKDRASFRAADFEALESLGVLQFVEGTEPKPPFDGVAWFVSNGHTSCQLLPIFGRPGDQRLLFVGDVVPTVAHLRLGWVMAYDLHPLTTIAEKQALYRRCFDEGLMLAFPHDPKLGGAMVDGEIERPIVCKSLPL